MKKISSLPAHLPHPNPDSPAAIEPPKVMKSLGSQTRAITDELGVHYTFFSVFNRLASKTNPTTAIQLALPDPNGFVQSDIPNEDGLYIRQAPPARTSTFYLQFNDPDTNTNTLLAFTSKRAIIGPNRTAEMALIRLETLCQYSRVFPAISKLTEAWPILPILKDLFTAHSEDWLADNMARIQVVRAAMAVRHPGIQTAIETVFKVRGVPLSQPAIPIR